MNRAMEFLSRNKVNQWIITVMLTVVSGALFAQAEDPIQLLDKEQTKKAVSLLREASKATPSAQSWFNLGYGLLRTGEVKEALSSFDQGIALDEKFALNYVGKGWLKLKEGNLTDATALFEKAQGLGKKNVDVLNTIGEAYLENPKFVATALDFLVKAESINNQNVKTLILLGDAYLGQNTGNGGKAVSTYEKAAGLAPKNGTPMYKVGIVYLRSTNYDVALESFIKSTQADPNYTLAYKEIGELYYLKKMGPEAVKAQEKYIELTEKPETGKLRLAYYLFMAKDYTKANAVFEELSKQGAMSETAYKFFSKSLMETGQDVRALEVFDQFLSTAKPEQIEAGDYATQGNLLNKLATKEKEAKEKDLGKEKDSLAVIAFDKSLAIDGKQTTVLVKKAEILYARKRYKESADAYKVMMATRPKPLAQDHFAIGRAYYYSSQFAKADSIFQKLIEMQPNMTVGYLWAGNANAQLDPDSEKGLAKPFYEKLIEKATPEKNKSDLISAYQYLGYYYFVKKDYTQSLPFWEKAVALDPANQRSKDGLDVTKQMLNPPAPKR